MCNAISVCPKDMVTKYNHKNWFCLAKITLCLYITSCEWRANAYAKSVVLRIGI